MKNLTVQGDDVIFGCDSIHANRLVIGCYIKIGYEIHPMKTFLSDHRGEFLRRSYELQGITGYNTRTLLSIRFMNPIRDTAILPVERLYSRLNMWHLLGLRSGNEPECGKLALEEAERVGLERKWVVRFFMTPNCVGEAGVDHNSRFDTWFKKEWDGKWANIVITRETKEVQSKMGHWVHRLREKSIALDEMAMRDFRMNIVRTWGIKESRLFGDCSYEWREIERVLSRYHGDSLNPVLDNEDLWRLDEVPVMVRGLYQRSLMRGGDWRPRVRETNAR